jgi:hypothetical protein
MPISTVRTFQALNRLVMSPPWVAMDTSSNLGHYIDISEQDVFLSQSIRSATRLPTRRMGLILILILRIFPKW